MNTPRKLKDTVLKVKRRIKVNVRIVLVNLLSVENYKNNNNTVLKLG